MQPRNHSSENDDSSAFYRFKVNAIKGLRVRARFTFGPQFRPFVACGIFSLKTFPLSAVLSVSIFKVFGAGGQIITDLGRFRATFFREMNTRSMFAAFRVGAKASTFQGQGFGWGKASNAWG